MSWLIGQSIINGLLIGGVYALIAVSLTIIFGVMKIVNFAQGEFLMVGMYATWLLYSAIGGSPYLLIIPVAFIMFIFGWLVYKILINPVVGKGDTAYILLTVGLSFFLQNAAQLIWTADYHTVETTIKGHSIQLGELSILTPRLIAFLVAIVLVAVIHIFLKKTDIGRAMRATAENSQIASMLGINPVVTYAIAFSIGAVLAGLAGVLLTPMFYVFPRVGALFTTTAFVVVVLGGMGNITGALLGGLLIGLVEAFTGSFIALDLAPVGTFVVFLLALLLKPEGLFGGGTRKA
ncbi:branched-chain amino acid ABC transporter permease [Petroclostridium xylanilyticum]|uniref:branched-chain amino acid ABC transporter permease n=1 Tax=Petroclostridium xylanilyticum TaxID=1792311 RepID=UPI000B992ADB|nr:branched-chain amino acid ABC transporter permease [Petroclostridium xylanilyticum]